MASIHKIQSEAAFNNSSVPAGKVLIFPAIDADTGKPVRDVDFWTAHDIESIEEYIEVYSANYSDEKILKARV